MKHLLSATAFIAGFAVARLVLGLFGLSPVVQLLGGAWVGYLVAQPLWSHYSDREAFKRVHGIFGGTTQDADVAPDDVRRPAQADGLEAARSLAARSEPADGFATRLRPVQCPACGARYERRPETTFLGFQRFTCGDCRMVLRGPLSWGYRALWWICMVAVGGTAFVARGGLHPGMTHERSPWIALAVLINIPVLVDAATLLLPRRRRTFLR